MRLHLPTTETTREVFPSRKNERQRFFFLSLETNQQIFPLIFDNRHIQLIRVGEISSVYFFELILIVSRRKFRNRRKFFHFVQITGARTRFRSEESRQLHEDLVQQAEERARLQKMSRFHENIAEMHVSVKINLSTYHLFSSFSIQKR